MRHHANKGNNGRSHSFPPALVHLLLLRDSIWNPDRKLEPIKHQKSPAHTDVHHSSWLMRPKRIAEGCAGRQSFWDNKNLFFFFFFPSLIYIKALPSILHSTRKTIKLYPPLDGLERIVARPCAIQYIFLRLERDNEWCDLFHSIFFFTPPSWREADNCQMMFKCKPPAPRSLSNPSVEKKELHTLSAPLDPKIDTRQHVQRWFWLLLEQMRTF